MSHTVVLVFIFLVFFSSLVHNLYNFVDKVDHWRAAVVVVLLYFDILLKAVHEYHILWIGWIYTS